MNTSPNIPLKGDIVLSALGYGMLIAQQSIMIWSAEFAPIPPYGASDVMVLRAIYLGTLLIAMAIWATVSKRVKRTTWGIMAISAALCIGLGILGTFLQVSFPILCVMWGLSGLGTASLMTMWAHSVVSLNQKQSIAQQGVAFLIAGVAMIAFWLIPSPWIYVFALFVPLISIAASYRVRLTATSRITDYRKEFQPSRNIQDLLKGQEKGAKLFKVLKRFTNMCNVLVGFSAACFTAGIFSLSSSFLVGIAHAGVGVLALLALAIFKKSLNLNFTLALLPFLTIQLLALTLGNQTIQLVAILLTLVFMTMFEIVNTSALTHRIRQLCADYEGIFLRCRVGNRFSYIIGWVCGLITIYLTQSGFNGMGASAVVLLGYASISVIMLLMNISFGRTHKTELNEAVPTEPAHTADEEVQDEATQADVLPAESGNAKATTAASPSVLTIDEAVDAIATQLLLSKRETEICALLARGRNVKYIAEHLVISTNTVRFHSNNLYGKLNVHSKQELIDLVEQVRLSSLK